MRLWKAVLLANLALALGFGAGYLRWAREVRALRQELASPRETPAMPRAGPQSWVARGIVRLTLPDQGAVFLTHEAIPGLMDAMTMGFLVAEPGLLDGLEPGDRVVFTIEQRGPQLVLVRIERKADQ
jgi:Cu/Ag efflux protein CusF